MSARGRGNVTIKRGTPNLAQAGKRESITNGKPIRKDTRDVPRGGRGGSRGGRGGRKSLRKPELIQTEGIFSEGLHSEVVKKNRDNENISFARDSRNGLAKKNDEAQMEIENGKASFGGWDALWRSDSEAEDETLEKILSGDDFIVDYKKGDRLPIVLPEKDEQQYKKLMSKNFKQETIKDEDMHEEKYSLDKISNPTEFLSKEAGAALIKAVEEGSSDSLILFQLPSVVNVLAGLTSDTSSIPENSTGETSHCSNPLPNLPLGKKIGKLQITKGGRTLLRVGNTVMDVIKTAPSDLCENAVLLETKPESSTEAAVFRAQDTGNSIYHLGEIRHRLVASLDWKDFKTTTMQEEAPQPLSQKGQDPSIIRELRALEKETEKWKIDAERWSKP